MEVFNAMYQNCLYAAGKENWEIYVKALNKIDKGKR